MVSNADKMSTPHNATSLVFFGNNLQIIAVTFLAVLTTMLISEQTRWPPGITGRWLKAHTFVVVRTCSTSKRVRLRMHSSHTFQQVSHTCFFSFFFSYTGMICYIPSSWQGWSWQSQHSFSEVKSGFFPPTQPLKTLKDVRQRLLKKSLQLIESSVHCPLSVADGNGTPIARLGYVNSL